MSIDIRQIKPTPCIRSNLPLILHWVLLPSNRKMCSRYIDCTLLHQENLFLSIRNTTQPVNITEHGITTTKEPAGEHGYGLAGVCRVLDRRRAEYIYDYKNGWFQFTAEIPGEK